MAKQMNSDLSPITMTLSDQTGLVPAVGVAYVAGWINGGSSSINVLQSDGTFGTPTDPTKLPFYTVSSVPTIQLTQLTNGNDRLIFVVATSKPENLHINGDNNVIQYTAYPYPNTPGVPAPGPFDIFEFGYNAQADVSAVNGFGLNLSFSYNSEWYGTGQSRSKIGAAFSSFMNKEAGGAHFSELYYNSSIGNEAPPPPPPIDKQYFAIADPNDMLQAKQTLGMSDDLTSYWDDTMEQFFTVGNYLSINLSAGQPTNIYSGECTLQTNPNITSPVPTYTLTNGTNSINFYMPPSGIETALYVFQQAFGNYSPTPSDANGDAGLLQDNIWEALNRGVALSDISTTPINSGESTIAWNNSANWYQSGNVCNLYAKFLHYSDINGNDSRLSGNPPIFYNNAAYGFSMDEDPNGVYNGGNVPSKTETPVGGGSTINIVLGLFQ
jgi:hypothetical protein